MQLTLLVYILSTVIIQKTNAISLSHYVCHNEELKWACDAKTRHRLARSENDKNAQEASPLAAKDDDPACENLKKEYDTVCFTVPTQDSFVETKAFCDAFTVSCAHILKTNLFTNLKEIPVDYSAYCKAHKERYRYVCPAPLRFHTYVNEAVDFCARYQERCPQVELPLEPTPYKDKDEFHIYIREIEAPCKMFRRFARNYCTDPDLLKFPKYQIPCAKFKYMCLDVYNRVIYGK